MDHTATRHPPVLLALQLLPALPGPARLVRPDPLTRTLTVTDRTATRHPPALLALLDLRARRAPQNRLGLPAPARGLDQALVPFRRLTTLDPSLLPPILAARQLLPPHRLLLYPPAALEAVAHQDHLIPTPTAMASTAVLPAIPGHLDTKMKTPTVTEPLEITLVRAPRRLVSRPDRNLLLSILTSSLPPQSLRHQVTQRSPHRPNRPSRRKPPLLVKSFHPLPNLARTTYLCPPPLLCQPNQLTKRNTEPTHPLRRRARFLNLLKLLLRAR